MEGVFDDLEQDRFRCGYCRIVRDQIELIESITLGLYEACVHAGTRLRIDHLMLVVLQEQSVGLVSVHQAIEEARGVALREGGEEGFHSLHLDSDDSIIYLV